MKDRILTAAVLIPVALAAGFAAQPIPIFLLCALLAGLCYRELRRLGRLNTPNFPLAATAAFIFYGHAYFSKDATWSLFDHAAGLFAQLLGLTLFGVLAAALLVRKRSYLLLEAGSLWAAAPLISLALLHQYNIKDGQLISWNNLAFLTVLPIWIGDTLAYFVGKNFGRTPFAPRFSPKKTWEGAIANLTGTMVGAWLIGQAIGVPTGPALICGFLAGTLGQVGDLFESALKRYVGVKDTGGLLPGHGGVLDRLDSLLLSLPAQALVLALMLPPQR